MKKALIGLAAGAALTFAASTAYADGYAYGSVKDAAPVQQVNWNGLYIGAGVGYGIASTELDLRYVDTYYEESGSIFNLDGLSSKGFQGVVTLGYDRQVHPNVVLGVFGDYAFGDLETSASVLEGLLRLDAELSDSWAVGARLGFIRSCCTMWYVTAGYSQADLDWSVGFLGETVLSDSKTLDGWFIGGGVEQQLRDNLFLKLDYRYTSYDSEQLVSEWISEGERIDLNAETEVHSVRLGVNWKVDLFGGRHAAPAYESLK